MTKEMLEDGTMCGSVHCNKCGMERICKSGAYPCANICREILAERAEREKNPGVWDGAPDNAEQVQLVFWPHDLHLPFAYLPGNVGLKRYTRTLPKTKAREIAEKWAKKWELLDGKSNIDAIESAINEALAGGGK